MIAFHRRPSPSAQVPLRMMLVETPSNLAKEQESLYPVPPSQKSIEDMNQEAFVSVTRELA